MTHETDVVARIMTIRNGMIVDADAEALIRDALDARQTSPVSASTRDAFEAWAKSDNRAIQPLEFEDRADDNNHYYESDYDNNAFIGWKAAGLAPTPAGEPTAYLHRCRDAECEPELSFEPAKNPQWTSEPLYAASPDTSTDRQGD
jgi:hypothetical protein